MFRTRSTKASHYTNFSLGLEMSLICLSHCKLCSPTQIVAPHVIETSSVRPYVCHPLPTGTKFFTSSHEIRYRTSLLNFWISRNFMRVYTGPSESSMIFNAPSSWPSVLSMFIDRFGRNSVQDTPIHTSL